MREFNASKRDGRRAPGLQPQHWGASLPDGPVVLLDEIVKIPVRAHFDRFPARVYAGELAKTLVGRGIAIEIDGRGPGYFRPRHGSLEKRLRRLDRAIFTQQ